MPRRGDSLSLEHGGWRYTIGPRYTDSVEVENVVGDVRPGTCSPSSWKRRRHFKCLEVRQRGRSQSIRRQVPQGRFARGRTVEGLLGFSEFQGKAGCRFSACVDGRVFVLVGRQIFDGGLV